MAKKAKKREPYTPERVLKNWREMRQAIPNMTEDELKAALDVELEGEKRKDFVWRLQRRLANVRKKNELEKMKEAAT